MTTNLPSDDDPAGTPPETSSSGQAFSNAQPSPRQFPGSRYLSTAAVILGLTGLAVLGFGISVGWFSSSRTELAARQDSAYNDSFADSPSDSTAAHASGHAAASAQAPVPEFSPPPLDALAPEESVAILEECKRVVHHLSTLMPASLDALEMQARYEFEFGKVESARAVWSRILTSDPRNVFALRGLADIATLDGAFKEAVTYNRRAVLAEPNNLSHQVQLGVALLAAEEPTEARAVLQAVTAREKGYVDAHLELAAALVQENEIAEALGHFEAALALAPENAKVHFGLATLYNRRGDKEKAKHHQTEHQRLQAGVREKLQAGRRNYDDIAALRIDVAKLYTDMARVYVAGGHVKAAEFLLLRVSRSNPKDVESRQALAWLAGVQGRTHDSIRWLRAISDLRPGEFTFAREIANLYTQSRQLEEAGKVLVDFVAQNPKHAEAARTAAQFFLDVQPNEGKAIKYAQAAVQLEASGESYALLSAIYEASNQLDKAATAIERAIELDPTNATYRQLLALLREQSPAGKSPAKSTQP